MVCRTDLYYIYIDTRVEHFGFLKNVFATFCSLPQSILQWPKVVICETKILHSIVGISKMLIASMVPNCNKLQCSGRKFICTKYVNKLNVILWVRNASDTVVAHYFLFSILFLFIFFRCF